MEHATGRLLLVTHYYPAHGGGIEMVAGEIATRLLASGRFHIEWHASNSDCAPSVPGLTTRPAWAWNCVERKLGIPYPIWSPAAMLRLAKAVYRSDSIHIHDALYLANVTAAWLAIWLQKRLVITQHIGVIPYRNLALRLLHGIANRWVAVPVLRRSQVATFVSPVVQAYFEDLAGGLPRARLVPNGVDHQLFRPPFDELERRSSRAELDANNDRPAILFVGRHVERKGLELVESLARSTPDWIWYLIGEGPIDPDDWDLPNVKALGRMGQTQLAGFYRACDILVLPSVGEGFPLVVQEAMSCGLMPAVDIEVAAAGEIPDGLILSESVMHEDAADRWLELMSAFIEQPPSARQMQSDRIAEFARKAWSWHRVATEFESLLLSSD